MSAPGEGEAEQQPLINAPPMPSEQNTFERDAKRGPDRHHGTPLRAAAQLRGRGDPTQAAADQVRQARARKLRVRGAPAVSFIRGGRTRCSAMASTGSLDAVVDKAARGIPKPPHCKKPRHNLRKCEQKKRAADRNTRGPSGVLDAGRFGQRRRGKGAARRKREPQEGA